MDNGDVTFIVGFILAMLIFSNADLDVRRQETEEAEVICATHQGVDRIKPNVLNGYVTGVCKDGLKFSRRFEVKR